MSSTLTDSEQWRRYIIAEIHVHNTLYREGDRPIRGEGACKLIWGIPENAHNVDLCLSVPEPSPPSPRSPLAPTLDGNPLWGMASVGVAMVLMGLGIVQLATWALALVRWVGGL